MNKFIKTIVVYVMLTLLSMLALDGLYTFVYSNSVARNKVQYAMNASPKHYDAIILGSSRAENHLIPEMFHKSGLNVYNFGMSGGSLCEDSLLLKLFFEKGNTTDKIILQVDLQFLSEASAEGIQAEFLPYLATNKTIYHHYQDKIENEFGLAYFPFYRYCKLDSKIGLRELVITLMKKKAKFYKTNGFVPLDGTLNTNLRQDLPKVMASKNKYYDEIVAISKINKVQLIPFIAPFCKYANNRDFFSKLNHRIPELHDYSNFIKEDSLFATCGHLNKKGAAVFTRMIVEQLFGINNMEK
ncbi:hypothetical protein SAMN05443549_103206 [Flavobacterium fluvii]|uniref:DUF1574 domain-containing protein n=1 Tax=Flavobacterium fluvii TaxID=468056 RepID=A0A1M5IR76_9FLAO|nr:hypothetical protein [Flavobacterium fluvii]SHG30817.1 hypothetical protein SAMN05443549_103206 [Flavobacterium fluvii]